MPSRQFVCPTARSTKKEARRVEDGNQGEGSGRGALREKRESLFVHQQTTTYTHAARRHPRRAGAFWCGRDLFPNSATCVSSEARVPRLPPKHRAGARRDGIELEGASVCVCVCLSLSPSSLLTLLLYRLWLGPHGWELSVVCKLRVAAQCISACVVHYGACEMRWREPAP